MLFNLFFFFSRQNSHSIKLTVWKCTIQWHLGHAQCCATITSNKHLKRCLTSLVIRKMKIKTTMSYHFTPTRMAWKRKQKNRKVTCCRGCGKIGTFIRCCWECKIVQLPWKTVWGEVLKMLNMEFVQTSDDWISLPFSNCIFSFLTASSRICLNC